MSHTMLDILCARILCDGCLVRTASAARKRENRENSKSRCARAVRRENAKTRKFEKSKKQKCTKKHEKSKIRKSEYTSCLCLMPQAAFKRMPFALFCARDGRDGPRGEGRCFITGKSC